MNKKAAWSPSITIVSLLDDFAQGYFSESELAEELERYDSDKLFRTLRKHYKQTVSSLQQIENILPMLDGKFNIAAIERDL